MIIPGWSQGSTETFINSSTVEFVVNTNEFIQNDDYQLFITETIPFIKVHSKEIKNILLIGCASPEGKRQTNINLSQGRANKIYSYISYWVPKDKITIDNDYTLFLFKTGLDESDYRKLRSVYIEIQVEKQIPSPQIANPTTTQVDTVYQKDTVYLNKKNDKIVFGIYNSLSGDLLKRPNIGVEFYFHRMSWFAEGSFSRGYLFNKNYNIDIWHTGLRKYFNDKYDKLYIEIYGRAGWYDTDLFVKDDNGMFGVLFGGGVGMGYKFKVCKHWTITPCVRIGFDWLKFKDYYTKNNVGIDVSFGEYTDGKNPTTPDNQSINTRGEVVYLNDKTINKEFFNSAYNMYWFGPTYIGATIQRDFYLRK